MTIPAQLPVGETIRRDTERLPAAPHLQPPFIRLSEPYDLFLSTGCVLQLDRASMLENRGPHATHVEVVVHSTSDSTYIVLVPRNDPHDLRAESLAMSGKARSAAVRSADDVLMAGGIVQVPHRHYYMETGLTQLEGYGWVVAGNWTTATDRPRLTGARSLVSASAGRAAAETAAAEALLETEPATDQGLTPG